MNTSELVLWVVVGGMALAASPVGAQQAPTLFSIDGGPADLAGRSVSAVADLDGDGVGDLLVGSPQAGSQLGAAGSSARVHSSKTGVVLRDWDGGALWPERPSDGAGPSGVDSSFGWATAGIGDTDGDGVGDMLVGSPNHLAPGGGPGRVALFSGGSGELLGTLEGGQPSDAAGLPGTDAFGWSLAGVDDADGDGRDDVLVGAPLGDYARVHSSATGALIHHLQPDDLTPGAEFGHRVVALGDWDGDGVGDLAVSAPSWGAGFSGEGPRGRVYLFSGADGSQLRVLTGGGAQWQFGRGLAAGLDVNADGLEDLAVGAPGLGSGRGRVLVYARRGGDAWAGPALVLEAPRRQELGFGTSVARAGDLDDDGHDDVLVGVPFDVGGGGADVQPLNSHVVAFSGATGAQLARVDAPAPGWQLGASLAFVGDVFDTDSDAFALGAPGYAASSGRAVLAYVPGPSQQSGLPEPQTALAGRPGSPTLVKVPGGVSNIDFGTLVVTPQADGDSVAGELFEESGTTFTEFGEETVGHAPQEATTGDFDGNGRDDFATANEEDDSFSTVVTHDGAGFSGGGGLGVVSSTGTGGNPGPKAIIAGDLNADGFDDIVVSGQVGVSVYLNDTSGGFVNTDLHLLSAVTDLDLADVDADGILDVLVSRGGLNGAGGVTVLLGDDDGGGAGDGTFTLSQLFGGGPPVVSAQVADLDGDLDLDVTTVVHFVTLGIPRARMHAYLNDGAGVFAEGAWPALQISDLDGYVPTYGALNDINRDGLPDLVLTSNDNAFAPAGSFDGTEPPLEVTLMLNRGLDLGGVWLGFSTSVMGTAYAGRAVEPLLEDVFTDPNQPLATDPDLILVWYMDEQSGQSPVPQLTTFIGILIGDGEGGFFDPDPNQFVLGDQPGDGDQGDLGSADDAQGVAGADGKLDLVFPNLVDNSLKLLLGDGEGGVASVLTIEDVDELDPAGLPPGLWSGGPRMVRSLHLNDDGLIDLVVYNDWRDIFLGDVRASLSTYLATGGGAFQKAQYLTLPRAGDMAVADVDLDGDADVVIGLRLGPGLDDSLAVYRSDGEGLLATTPEVVKVPGRTLTGGMVEGALGSGPARVVVVTGRDPVTKEGVVLAYGARAQLGLAEPVVSPLGANWKLIEGLALADMDGDGHSDLCLGTVSGKLLLARGDGQGGFALSPLNPSVAAVGGGAIAVGRVDGDYKLDVVSSKGSVSDQAGVHVLSGTGAGDFTANLLAGLSASGQAGAQRPLLVDFDDDGTLDVVLTHGTSNAISVLLSELNTTETVDPGAPGSGGITPALSGKGYTTSGSILELELDDAVGGGQGWLLFGTELAPGQVPAVALDSVVAVQTISFGGVPGVPGAGDGGSYALRLPADPAFLGAEFLVQLVVFDPGAASDATLSASNALSVTILE